MAPRRTIFLGREGTLILILLVFAISSSAQSSEYEPLSIDRPDVSNLPTTVLPRQYQLETGLEWSRGTSTHEFYVPNLMFRTGINRKAELRLGFNQLFLDSLGSGLRDNVLYVSIGGKYRFLEEKNGRPAIAVQTEFSLPFGDGYYIHRDYPNYSLADYSVVFLFNNTLHKQVFLNYNAGVFWSKRGRVDYLLSASASFLHTHRLGYFFEGDTLIETAGSLPLSFDGGLMFLVSPRIQVDSYFGNRGIEEGRFWYYGFGVGFRIDPGDLQRKSFGQQGIIH